MKESLTSTVNNNQILLQHFIHWARVFNREALHFQQLSQRIILAVDYVLPLFVIQLLPHDVLAQVVHHLFEREDILLGSSHTQYLQERGFWLHLIPFSR